jgi:hypothetical protein
VIVLCAVCFRGGDALARESLNAGIAVLLGVTAVVLACFAVFFIRLARRSRQTGFDAAAAETGYDAAFSFKPGLQR